MRVAITSGVWRAIGRGVLLGIAGATLCGTGVGRAQVFTVGEQTAMADIKTDFSATRVELPTGPMTVRARRELVSHLQAEQGFAHRVLPLGSVVTLMANGNLTPGAEEYRKLVYKKGQAAAAGDRVVVTALEVKGDRILIDLNGGPHVKHRFLRHLSVGVGAMAVNNAPPTEEATGCRVTLLFEGGVPAVDAPEVKALLEPLVDFGVKTGEQAYADTLPTLLREAIASHEILVGMDRRMVLAALGAPEQKLRESSPEQGRYEEWIYGHQPQTIRFVRFVGDRVALIKVASMGKPVEVRDKDEVAGAYPAAPPRVIGVGDGPGQGGSHPSLVQAGEAAPAGVSSAQDKRVQYPPEHKPRNGVSPGEAVPQ